MQINKNKIIAILFTLILVSSIAISLSALQAANGEVINGVNYDAATAAAINAGMNWQGMNANASATRLLLWNRFQDQIPTWSYIITAPNPIGVGQTANIVMFNPQVPPSALLTNQVRYKYTMTITDPNGTTTTYPTATPPAYSAWSQNSIGNLSDGTRVFVSDSTGSTYMSYTPDQIGNYTLTLKFEPLLYIWNTTLGGTNDYYGTTFLSSNFTTTLSVQKDPVNLSGLTLPSIPSVPSEYWTRPIEQENAGWYSIASNWLHNGHDFNNGGGQNQYQPDGTAPTTGHILWTRPTEDSGILGGSDTTRSGNSFNTGSQYQPRFTNPIIMYGRLYFSPNLYTSGSSELLDCVDLKTGQLLWEENTTSFTNPAASAFSAGLGTSSTANVPQFGYYYSQDDPNEHGLQNPGWLFTTNYGIGYQPERGIPQLHIANVPSGGTYLPEITGPAGEGLRYVFQNSNGNLLQWNSSKVIPMIAASATPTSYILEGNVPITPTRPGNSVWNGTAWVTSAAATAVGIASSNTNPSYDWNVSLTYNGEPFKFANTPTIVAASLSKHMVFGYNGTWPQFSNAPSYAFPDNITVWEINTNTGELAYLNTLPIDNPTANTNFIFEHADIDAGTNGVFVALEEPLMIFHVYDMSTGNQIWQSDAQANTITPYNYYTWSSLISQTQTKIAYGMLYTGGYGGSISAYALNSTGNNVMPVWRTPIIPPGTAGVIKSSPAMMSIISNGIIYVGTHEHSAETPLEPGNNVKALNATTGQYIWAMSGWMYPLSVALADGVLIYWNDYDAQIYAVGQGPTSMTVTAPSSSTPLGNYVTIRGTITDVSAGTQQEAVKANFPNGLPAVSDASMSQWMEYVYMQKAKPTNTTGVPVDISVVDANGNTRSIGTAVSDSSGMFTFNWKPDIQGAYTVIATFAGSHSYYGSSAETSFYTGAAASTPAQVQSNGGNASPVDQYLLPGIAAIIVVMVVIGAAIMMMLRKR